jgi:hypothetical protein
MSETMIPNYRYSVEVRDDKVNQSAGIGAKPKVRFEASPEQSRSVSQAFAVACSWFYHIFRPLSEVVSGTGFLTLSVNVFDFAKLFLRCVTCLSSLRGIGFESSKSELNLILRPVLK